MTKEIKWAACAVMSILLVTGCSAAKLPEGDVKVVNQQMSGVIDLLLKSANYGEDQSTVESVLLPTGSSYEIKMVVDQYESGELVNTIEVPNYTTDEMEKNSLVHLVLNVGKDDVKSILTIAEVDQEKTTDDKNPEYKLVKTETPAINFEKRVTLEQYGGELGKEFVLAAYTTGGSSDINLETYQDEIANYDTASIVKVTITEK